MQDEILELTLVLRPTTVAVNRKYRPPWQLQVNRATGKKVAENYYATSTFFVKDQDDRVTRVLGFWLKSLTEEHHNAIVCIQAYVPTPFDDPKADIAYVEDEKKERQRASQEVEEISLDLDHLFDIELADGVLMVNYPILVCEGFPDWDLAYNWTS